MLVYLAGGKRSGRWEKRGRHFERRSGKRGGCHPDTKCHTEALQLALQVEVGH